MDRLGRQVGGGVRAHGRGVALRATLEVADAHVVVAAAHREQLVGERGPVASHGRAHLCLDDPRELGAPGVRVHPRGRSRAQQWVAGEVGGEVGVELRDRLAHAPGGREAALVPGPAVAGQHAVQVAAELAAALQIVPRAAGVGDRGARDDREHAGLHADRGGGDRDLGEAGGQLGTPVGGQALEHRAGDALLRVERPRVERGGLGGDALQLGEVGLLGGAARVGHLGVVAGHAELGGGERVRRQPAAEVVVGEPGEGRGGVGDHDGNRTRPWAGRRRAGARPVPGQRPVVSCRRCPAAKHLRAAVRPGRLTGGALGPRRRGPCSASPPGSRPRRSSRNGAA